jgi:hypothetical protein
MENLLVRIDAKPSLIVLRPINRLKPSTPQKTQRQAKKPSTGVRSRRSVPHSGLNRQPTSQPARVKFY